MVVNLGKEQTGQSISWSRRQTDERSQLISLKLDSDNPPAGEPHWARPGQPRARDRSHDGATSGQPRMQYPCGLAGRAIRTHALTHPGTSRGKGSSSSSVVVTRSPCTRGEPQGGRGRASSQPACRRNGAGAREASTAACPQAAFQRFHASRHVRRPRFCVLRLSDGTFASIAAVLI